MPPNIPSTTWVIRSPMKLRSIREVYWLDASARVTSVIEKVTPTTVIIEPAIVESTSRAPPAPEPKTRGHRSIHGRACPESSSIKPRASAMLAAKISEGTNQKLLRRLLHKSSRRVMPHYGEPHDASKRAK